MSEWLGCRTTLVGLQPQTRASSSGAAPWYKSTLWVGRTQRSKQGSMEKCQHSWVTLRRVQAWLAQPASDEAVFKLSEQTSASPPTPRVTNALPVSTHSAPPTHSRRTCSSINQHLQHKLPKGSILRPHSYCCRRRGLSLPKQGLLTPIPVSCPPPPAMVPHTQHPCTTSVYPRTCCSIK